MATLTSVQDGLWNASATWGGSVPAAADTMNVRHVVTFNLNDTGAATVYGRINVESNSIYSTGTITQNGTAVTGTGTTFTSGHVNKKLCFADGYVTTITAYTSATAITVADSRVATTLDQNFFIGDYYGQLIHGTAPTCLCTTSWIYINGGKYQQGPGATLKVKTTSSSSTTEGTGYGGINYLASVNGSQLIMQGTCPNLETALTSDVNIGDSCLNVTSSAGFVTGEYISVYRDHSADTMWGWCGRDQNDEGFIVHMVETGKVWIRHRVGVEDTIAAQMNIGVNTVQVNNPLKWQTGMKTWIDNEIFTITGINTTTGVLTFSANATVQHNTNAKMYETGAQKVNIYDWVTSNAASGASYIAINNVTQFAVNDVIKFQYQDETLTVSSIDYGNNRLYFSSNLTKAHSQYEYIYINNTLSHKTGDKVYKIATILTAQTNSGSNSITVADSTNLEVNDTIGIEGSARAYTNSIEAKITNKSGNVLTLDTNLASTAYADYIVIKLNRDCVMTSTNETDTACRPTFTSTTGTASIYGRKLALRYVEFRYFGNSNTGINIRGDFNRKDCEREIRGCSFHNFLSYEPSGLYPYTAHYIHTRNCVLHRTYRGIYCYASNGSSFYNNISMSCYWGMFSWEAMYSYNQFQYNIGTNSSTYSMYYGSDYNSNFPMTHNIYKHTERGPMATNTSLGQFTITQVKNKWEDLYYKHVCTDGTKSIIQDAYITLNASYSAASLGNAYSNPDDRQMMGGGLILLNKDFIQGNFEYHLGGGWLEKDTTVTMNNKWSFKATLNNSNIDVRLNEFIYVQYGTTITVTAYFRKNSSYNGILLPRISIKGKYLGYSITEMPNLDDQWCRVQKSITVDKSQLIEIGVGGRGSAGNFWLDPRVSVITNNTDIVKAVGCVNLMFGLEEIYQSNPSVILSSTQLGV